MRHAYVLGVMAACVLSVLAGCKGNGSSSAMESNPGSASTAKTYVGVLQGGMMGIGGEHTGWVLEIGSKERVEVDVRAVARAAAELQGRKVRVSGQLVQKAYVERGNVTVLVASKIEAVS